MTKIISAYPCLGKTTIGNLNKDRIFDREFNESRSVRGMNEAQKSKFFDLCSQIVNLQIETGCYDYIFVTDDLEILKRLDVRPNEITVIFPNIFDSKVRKEYKNRVIKRSGEAWFKRVISPEINNLAEKIELYRELGFDVRLTEADEFIGDVFEFSNQIALPKI